MVDLNVDQKIDLHANYCFLAQVTVETKIEILMAEEGLLRRLLEPKVLRHVCGIAIGLNFAHDGPGLQPHGMTPISARNVF